MNDQDGPTVQDSVLRQPVIGAHTFTLHGRLHRTDGPAIMYHDGSQSWYIRGIYIESFDHFQQATGCSDQRVVMLKLRWGDITY